MTIGEKIKALRQKNDVTQEKLAEYLNISYQSVSKWENNNAMPDISLVIPIANFFGISIDELFDHDVDMQNADVDEYRKKDLELAHQGYIAERIALWREASYKYPRNSHCLLKLAYALWDTLNLGDEFESCREENAKEVISLCERILRDCTDNNERNGALQLLVFTYGDFTLSVANEKKAVSYANMTSDFYTCRDMLLEHAYFTNEGKKKALKQKHHNNLQFLDCLCMNIHLSTGRTPREEIFACETALKMWSALIYDENYLFYHCRIASIYSQIAACYAKLEDRDKTLEAVKKALYHADKYDHLPNIVEHYTSVFVSAAAEDHSSSTKNYTETNTQLILKNLSRPCFDFIREDEEFISLTSK